MQNGKAIEIEDNGGLLDEVVPMDFLPGFSLEGIFRKKKTSQIVLSDEPY